MTVGPWPDKATWDNFFDDFRALLEKYPMIGNRMARGYAEDECTCEPEADFPKYDPNSPVFMQGVVIIVSHSNMDGFEDLSILEPFEQSTYLTAGLLSRAYTLMADG